MNIVVVNNFFAPRTGGSSHLSGALASSYAAAGHQVLVVTAGYLDAPAEEYRAGVKIVRLPSWALPANGLAISFDISFATRFGLARRIRTLLDDFQPDVIHQHGQFFDLTWATGRYARLRGIPVLLSVHTRLENPAALYSRALHYLDRFLVRPQLRRYQPRMVVMDVLMDRYIRTRYNGCYSGLEDLPVAVEPSWAGGGDGFALRARLGLLDVPVILSLGHVIPLRDRLTLVEALPAVLSRFPDAKVVVVGRIYYDRFRQRAAELGVLDSIVCTGVVPKGEIPDLLAAADVESHEQGIGMGTATLEAMSAAVPVVVPGRSDNFPGIDLVDGHNIFLCPIDDPAALAQKLIAVLADPSAATTVALAGQRLIQRHFTMDSVSAAHLRVLAKLVERDRISR